MSHYSRMRGTALAALIAIGGLGINGCATAQSASDTTANVAPAASAPAAPAVESTAVASTQLSTPMTAADGLSVFDVKLRQQATFETRPAKHQHSLVVARGGWIHAPAVSRAAVAEGV